MSAVTAPVRAGYAPTRPRPALGWAISDAAAVTWRNLRSMMRTPEVIVFSSIQPIIFVLTFRYVFGGAIQGLPGVPYVGFLIHAGWPAFLGGIGLVLLFSLAFSWVFALIGLGAKNAESAQAASFPILALLVFASSAFVPTNQMPHWLRAYADHQPVSDTVDAVRALVIGGPTARPVLTALAWMVGILAVFVPLSIARYRRT
jgi:ABC-type multidrug transport system permease subunit